MSMISKIPDKLKREMSDDPYFSICAFKDMHECGGRVTWEHAIESRGTRLNVLGAIIPCCEKAHGVCRYQGSKEELPKDMRVWVSLNIIDMNMLIEESPKQDWIQKRKYLNIKYGKYETNVRDSNIKSREDN
jgi:hypothetical protein